LGSFTLSLLAPSIECHHWISVCASAAVDASAKASAAMTRLRIIVESSVNLCGNGTSAA
jgi:hypothetical protein